MRSFAQGRDSRNASPRRFASTVSVVLVVLGIGGGLIVASQRWMNREPVRHFRISGLKALDAAEVIRWAGLGDPNTEQGSVDLDAVERRIGSHPFVAAVSVYRGEQGTLIAEIRERVPEGVVFIHGIPVYVDSASNPMPLRRGVSIYDVPVLSGVQRGDSADPAQVCEALSVARVLRGYDSALYRQISEIHRSVNGQYTLICADDGLPVMIGDTAGIMGRLPKLDAFWKNVLAVHGTQGIRRIDLRWEGQVVECRE